MCMHALRSYVFIPGETFPPAKVLGSAIAIVGVMLYSIAKATDKPPPTTLATAAKGRPSSRSEPKKRV